MKNRKMGQEGLKDTIVRGSDHLATMVSILFLSIRPCDRVYLEFKLLIGSLYANVVLIDLSASVPAGGFC